MAVNYPIPPWLAPQTNWGALAANRARLKADLAMRAQTLAQQQQQFNTQMEMRRMAMDAEERMKEQQLKQQAEVAKHRIAVDMAYNTVKAGLEQQRIGAINRKIDIDFQQQADEMKRIADFEQGVASDFAATGNLPESFKNRLMLGGASAGMPASAYSMVGARNSERAGVDGQPFMPEVITKDGIKFARTSPNQLQIIPPNKLTGGGSVARKRMIAPGRMEVIDEGGKSRIFPIAAFKFSQQKALDQLEASDLGKYLDEGANLSGLNSAFRAQVANARKRHAALLALQKQEREEYNALLQEQQSAEPPEDMGEDAGFDATYDPSSNSMLTDEE